MSRHGTAEDSTPEPEICQLDATGLTQHLQDALALVLETRPEDPIFVLATYFSDLVEGTPATSQAFRSLQKANVRSASFQDDLNQAYALLATAKGWDTPSSSQYAKLLRLLCSGFDQDKAADLRKIADASTSVCIDHATFCRGVTACLLFADVLRQTDELFSAYDKAGSEPCVPRPVLEQLCQRLQHAHFTDSQPPQWSALPGSQDVSKQEFINTVFASLCSRR